MRAKYFARFFMSSGRICRTLEGSATECSLGLLVRTLHFSAGTERSRDYKSRVLRCPLSRLFVFAGLQMLVISSRLHCASGTRIQGGLFRGTFLPERGQRRRVLRLFGERDLLLPGPTFSRSRGYRFGQRTRGRSSRCYPVRRPAEACWIADPTAPGNFLRGRQRENVLAHYLM